MTRPSVAYVGFGLSHPIRIVVPRGLHGNAAKLMTVDESLELLTDLIGAIQRAVNTEYEKITNDRTTAAPELPDNAGGTGD